MPQARGTSVYEITLHSEKFRAEKSQDQTFSAIWHRTFSRKRILDTKTNMFCEMQRLWNRDQKNSFEIISFPEYKWMSMAWVQRVYL